MRHNPGMGQAARVKLLLRSAMIFFGTLMAAGLVALGEPAPPIVDGNAWQQTPTLHALDRLVEFARPWINTAFAQSGR
jgi:hypothetical protein